VKQLVPKRMTRNPMHPWKTVRIKKWIKISRL
jgi:hypothetical protein